MPTVFGGRSVALCMIVRDEAAVIARSIESVRPMIDHWVICDTGSIDDTVAIVHESLGDVPGTLHRHEWVDFGHNRSLLMQAAVGSADLLLLVDADMTLEQRAPVADLDPDVDAWLVRHHGDLSYAVPRLVRGDRTWRFEGATHEFLTCDEPVRQRELSELVVHHHADGGSRSDKFERDERLLRAAVESDPADARAWFYLGQTLRDLGRAEEAVAAYRRRAELGGWDEEIAYAWLQVGLLLESDDPDAAMAALHNAWETRPSRAEPLHALARLHRNAGRHRSALVMADRGLSLPPSDDRLFVHRDVEHWGLRFERSIAAYWTGDVETALLDTDVLLGEPDLPADIAEHTQRNRTFCLERLADHTRPARPDLARLTDLAPDTRIARVDVTVDPVWPLCNPTIAADPDGGFRVVVRAVSYQAGADGTYRSLDADPSIRTINLSVHLDDDLHADAVDRLDDANLLEPSRPDAPVLGHEDLRLVHHDGRWWGMATVRDRTPDACCQVVLVEVGPSSLGRSRVLAGPDPERHEKNWMPVVRDGRLEAVYSCGPETVVLDIDAATANVSVVSRHAAHPLLAPWRGGSQLVPESRGGGHLAVIHDVIWVDGQRLYRHRLVRFDEMLRPIEATPWWTFEGEDVEFAAGLARRGDDLVISYGVRDAAAALAVVPEEQMLRRMDPVLRPSRPALGGSSCQTS